MMLRRAALGVLVVLLAASASAQATFDARTNAARTWTLAAPASTALSHTIGAGTNRLLIVAVHFNIDTPTGATVSNVTYGGVGMTQIAALNDGTPETRTEVWYLLNPTSGTASVLVTATGIAAGQTVRGGVSATSYSNAQQEAPVTATAFGDSTAPSVTIAASATTDTILDFVTARESTTMADGPAPQTQRYSFDSGGTSVADAQMGSSDRAAATPNTTMTWTLGTGRRWTQVAVNIRAARADVEIVKYTQHDPVVPGGTLTYTILVGNNGPSSATGVTVTDPLPAGVTFVSSGTTLGSCSGASTVTCTLGTMTSGQTATITITVTAPLTGGTIANNTATVATSTIDEGTPNTATATSYSLVQATVCGTNPGRDGNPGTISGTVNSYWQGSSNPAVGATTLVVTGARRGAAVSITSGDLVLIIQMQDEAIDSSNNDRYGDGIGTGGTTGIGAGYTNANNVGRYEYVIATSTVNAGGAGVNQNFTFTGVRPGGGLVYAYTNAAATATMGQRRYQIVRVPQYSAATLGAATASAWNGTTGGILALDIAGTLALGSATVNMTGVGFRGAAGRQLAGGGAATTVDYRNTAAQNTHGIKAEGTAGTPEWVLDSGANLDVGPAGYPNGDYARGAPGNAGGGGTDSDVALNQENSGGGGGGNWGRGGRGGNTWQGNEPTGGFGGAPFYDSPGRVVLGGGGGGGARNNSSGIASSGAAGGGIVLIRAGLLTGTATINANGAAAMNTTANDGGGGGGAGGAVVILSHGGGIGGLTINANGGRGGDAWNTQAPGAVYPGERHGPGGGGGGGYIALNGTPAATSVNGGANGITTTANDAFGAQPGAIGKVTTVAQFDEITGVKSGCLDLSVTTSDSPDPVIAGNNLTFTQQVTNNSTVVPGQNVVMTQTVPTGTTFVSMTAPAGWTCTTPILGGTGTVSCSYTAGPFPPSTSSGNFTFVVATDQALANGSTITQPVTVSSSNPDTNTANNTAQTTTTVIRRVDIAVTKVTNDDGSDDAFQQGETLIYTIVVTNNGPSRATNVVMTDPLPAGFSFVSVVPGGPTCTQASGTVTCTYATMNNGATQNIVITGTITVSQTQLVNTASTTRTETDTDPTNDSATATVSVLAPTLVHILTMSADQDPNGKVALRWATSMEVDNLGFNVYRQEAGGAREKINKHLINGSAFFSRHDPVSTGRSYRWKDKIKSGAFAQYWIEDVDLSGTRTMHGPVAPISSSVIPDEANTDTLVDLGSNGGVLVSPRGIGAPRSPATVPGARQLEQQWDLASQAAIKLMVTEEGWYRVTNAALAAAGFDIADAKKLALFTEGIEQPMLVTDDAVEFYGTGLDTISAGARAYWLVRDKGSKLRINKAKAKKGAAAVTSTPLTASRVQRSIFFTALVNNGEKENFFGPLIWSGGASADVEVEHLDPAGSATLEVILQGGTEGAHQIRVDLNGQQLAAPQLFAQDRVVLSLNVGAASLLEGANSVRFTSMLGDFDISVVESVRLTYPHRMLADDDALKVSANGGSTLSVGGFTTNRIRAIDVTDAALPIELEVEVSGSGPYSASAVAPESGLRSILVIGDARVLAPAQLVPSRASTWNARTNGADLVILTTRTLAPAAAPLQVLRDSQNIRTEIVDVQDLYDEFGYGHRGPEAIREFLQRTRSWSRVPRYALFVGDASFDPRNYLGMGAWDLVPTRLVPMQYMKTASDDWVADFNSDGIPELAVGRLPARTLAEAETMIRRITERQTNGNQKVSLIPDAPTSEYDFVEAAQSLGALVPSPYTVSLTGPDAAAWESLVLAYIGHGSVDVWNNGFHGGSALALTNTVRPVVAAMTCLNGYYHDLFMNSLAEWLLLNPNGGASAVWTSSSLTEPIGQLDMAKEFFRQLFAGARVGDAAIRAKAATTDPDVRRSWILFGDPSMPLQ